MNIKSSSKVITKVIPKFFKITKLLKFPHFKLVITIFLLFLLKKGVSRLGFVDANIPKVIQKLLRYGNSHIRIFQKFFKSYSKSYSKVIQNSKTVEIYSFQACNYCFSVYRWSKNDQRVPDFKMQVTFYNPDLS